MTLIRISLDYYDDSERILFQNFPNSMQLNDFVQHGLTISKGEFLSYMMFTEQMERDGFRTYDELTNRITQRLGDIDDYLSFYDGSVQAKIIGNEMMQGGFTERIGVALGLCVVSRIQGLTTADWKKIQTASGRSGHPTFDFEISIASIGTRFVQVENKGSTCVNNNLINNSVQDHYRRIKIKKRYVRSQEAILGKPIHNNLYYGTIGVLDNRINSTAKVWLVDPPASQIEMDPRKYKLLARLRYYLDEFKNIGVHPQITKALEKRVSEIENDLDYNRFNDVPLETPYPYGYRFFMEGQMFAAVNENEAFGRIFLIERNQSILSYIIAFPKALMQIIIFQNFENILYYNYNPNFENKGVRISIKLSAKGIEGTRLPKNLDLKIDDRRRYYIGTYIGAINYSPDGRIFGLLQK